MMSGMVFVVRKLRCIDAVGGRIPDSAVDREGLIATAVTSLAVVPSGGVANIWVRIGELSVLPVRLSWGWTQRLTDVSRFLRTEGLRTAYWSQCALSPLRRDTFWRKLVWFRRFRSLRQEIAVHRFQTRIPSHGAVSQSLVQRIHDYSF